MQSLAKMFIFLKMPSFTLFTMDLIRDTSWLQNALRIMFSSPAFQVRYSLYSATGDSVWKHLSSRDIGWKEDQEEKVNNPPKWDGYEKEVERRWEVGKGQSLWEHSYWVILLLTFFQLCQPCPRLGRPILLIAPNFQSWLCFRCSPMEESLCLSITSCCPRAYGQGWLRQNWDTGDRFSFSDLPSFPCSQSGSPSIHRSPACSFWWLGLLPWRSVYPDSSLLDLRLQNFLFPPPKCSRSGTCHSPARLLQLPWWQMTH